MNEPATITRLLPYLFTALSAFLFTLASPPADQGWLGWLALIPFFWVLLRAAAAPVEKPRHLYKRVFQVGFTWGFLFLMVLVPWFGAFTPVGYPVAGGYWGLLTGLWAMGVVWLLRRVPLWWAPLVLAAGWTLHEWLRAQGVLAFPWGTLAATQHRYLPVIQMLDLTGAYGLTFLMALFQSGLAAVGSRQSAVGSRFKPITWAAIALLVLLADVARGSWILSHPERPSGTARVAVVQQSRSMMAPGARVATESLPRDYDDATHDAIGAGAELVLWPEGTCQEDAVNHPTARRRLERLLRGNNTWLLAGSFVADDRMEQYTNAAVMLAPGGVARDFYAKVLIVPFGEYLPLRPLLRWTEQYGMPKTDLRGGTHWHPLPWSRGSVGVSICFESAFGPISREMVNRGANLLAVLTSDGWAGRVSAGLQHEAFSPLRAVEERRSVARAAATGVSELIDPYGRPVRTLGMFQKGYLYADLPLRTDRTLYSYMGDWPVLVSFLILAALAWTGRRRGASV